MLNIIEGEKDKSPLVRSWSFLYSYTLLTLVSEYLNDDVYICMYIRNWDQFIIFLF
jgi:hypothetical protein